MRLAVLIVFLLAASLRTWREIVRRWSTGTDILERAPRLPSPLLPLAWSAAAIYVGGLVALKVTSAALGDGAPGVVTLDDVRQGCVSGALVIVIAVALLTGFGRIALRDCGLGVGGFGRQLRDGVGAFLASFGPVFAVLAATSMWRSEEVLHPFLKLLGDSPSPDAIGWIVVAAVVVAPIQEELLFRVMLQDGLARSLGGRRAILLVAVLFCAVHGFPDSLALFPLALILGYVYEQRQNVLAVIVTHALFNLTNLVILLLGGGMS
ncbi:MAG: CPBP family intramembrane metalloprotease [Planctomycetaceae bacterium]|nr:CPBP family intramembrane metalloprotease [Planctomycetaceae bacterium]